MNSGAIVLTKAESAPPDTFTDKVLGKYNTMFGFAAAMAGESIDVLWYPSTTGPLKENLAEVFKEYGDRKLMLHFGKNEHPLSASEMQPFEIIKEGERVVVAVAIEGDLVGYDPEGDDKKTNEYRAITDFVADEIKREYTAVKGKLDELAKVLESAVFRKRILQVLVPRGVMTVMLANGDLITFQNKNSEQMTYSWGYSSRNVGYAEATAKAEEPAPPVEEKKLTLKERNALALKTGTVQAPPAEEKKVVVPEAPGKEGVVEEKKVEMVYPPPNQSGRELRKWYKRNRSGGEPRGWENKIPFPASELRENSALRKMVGKTMAEVGKVVGAVRSEPVKAVASTSPIAPEPVVAPVIVPEDEPGDQQEIIPVIGPGQQKEVLAYLKTVKPGDPDEILASAKKYPTATEQLDLKLSDVLRMRPHTLQHIIKHNQRTALLLVQELCVALIRARPALLEIKGETEAEVPEKEVKLTLKQRNELALQQNKEGTAGMPPQKKVA